MSQFAINPDDPAYLIVTREGEDPTTLPLERNASIFVGSGSNCRLVLPSDKVQQIHCMILLEESKQLKIQDWNTGQTLLNGTPIDEEAFAKTGDIIAVGEYQMIPVLDREFHLGIASELLSGGASVPAHSPSELPASELPVELPMQDVEGEYFEGSIDELISQATDAVGGQDITSLASPQDSSFIEPLPETDASPVPAMEVASASETLVEESSSVVDENATGPTIKTGGFVYDIDADMNDEQNDCPSQSIDFAIDFNSDFEDEAETQEESEMLRLEVEQLRFELAERDSRIAALRDSQSNTTEMIDDEQTLKLVSRLEELLDELKTSDERTRNLEELLRLSDEANQAENEERVQLESWVAEIETRVEQRESEFQAEIDRLTQRFQESKTQLENAEVQFKKLLKTQGESSQGAEMSAQSKELIEECRQQIQQLRQQLEDVTEENTKLRAATESAGNDDDVRQQLKETQEKLVALQVEGSRERAEMARRHAELERIRDELEERLNNVKAVAKDDSKIAAMRQHLREIHEQEKLEKEETRQKSLSGRIANLLTRLR